MEEFENSVTMNEDVQANPVDAGDGFGTDELQPEETQQEAPEQTANEQGVGGPAQGEEKPNQKDIGRAFKLEADRIRDQVTRDYETHPAYMTGMRLLNDLMQREGITMEQAAQRVEGQYVKAFAEREGVSEHVARMMLSTMQQPQRQTQRADPSEPDINARATQIRQELATVELPKGFDFKEAIKDTAFAELLLEMPVKHAVRLYYSQQQLAAAEQTAAQAPQQLADQLRARQSLPQQTKPQQPVTPTKNYMEMSDAEFMALDRQMKKGW